VSATAELESFQIGVDRATVKDLRERLGDTRWPSVPHEGGWDLGADLDYVGELCDHWRGRYDFARLEGLNELGSQRWGGLHLLRVRPSSPSRVPVVLLHGWPSAPLEYVAAARLLAEAGHDAIVPSLPGFAWSDDPGEALNVEETAGRLRLLISDGLGLESYAVAGGDWGAILAARVAFDAPESVVGVHISTPHTLPLPGNLAEPPPSEAETQWIERARRWRRRRGHHMVIQGLAPDAISTGLNDSPAGLAAYLLDKYRSWSDCDGDLERRFSKDELCDFLTVYWATGTIGSSMRLYYGERANRWLLQREERISVPAAVAAFPGEMRKDPALDGKSINPPREWTERLFSDLRGWSEMPSGGHFAAFEEPQLYAEHLVAFLRSLDV
jgi:pimeloyl-ACP methyl ester carboxylesterase